MKKFMVNVTETAYGFAIVEAENEQDARKKAEEQRHDGNVTWTSGVFKAHDAKEEDYEDE